MTALGPLAPTPAAHVALRPLPYDAVHLEGLLGDWQARNRGETIGHCVEQLEPAGNLDNFRRLIGRSDAPFRGFWFADTDVYKTLEAIGWAGGEGWEAFTDEAVGLMLAAREQDGYLDTWVQGVNGGRRWEEPETTHELYCLGHLIQGAIALARGAGRDDALQVACDFADVVVREGQDLLDGHPEIETALVELYRHTGREPYLALARRMIERRGHGFLAPGSFGSAYMQDHVPLRDATEATGHAVRQLYLAAGATDVYLETGDETLLRALDALWHSLYGEKTYVTGAHGSRHRDEALGDPFELPPDRAYGETCAAVASFQWNWRMLVATGEARFADEMERVLYNAIAGGVGEDGRHFFYSNSLHLRDGHRADEDAPAERLSWYACSCCPPNVGRLFGSLHHYAATAGADTLQLHLLSAASVEAGFARVRVQSAYPWDGRVELTVERGAGEWELAVRVPAWCDGALLDGSPVAPGYARLRRTWSEGDRVVLELPMPVRAIAAHPRVDAVRGCVALTRGPLVYCIEQADHAEALEDMRIDLERLPALDGETLTGPAAAVDPAAALYRPYAGPPAPRDATLTAIPYFRRLNRGGGAMRVWIPALGS
jgi:DUF1680 family protein